MSSEIRAQRRCVWMIEDWKIGEQYQDAKPTYLAPILHVSCMYRAPKVHWYCTWVALPLFCNSKLRSSAGHSGSSTWPDLTTDGRPPELFSPALSFTSIAVVRHALLWNPIKALHVRPFQNWWGIGNQWSPNEPSIKGQWKVNKANTKPKCLCNKAAQRTQAKLSLRNSSVVRLTAIVQTTGQVTLARWTRS